MPPIRSLAIRRPAALGLVCALFATGALAGDSRRALLGRFFERIGQIEQAGSGTYYPVAGSVIPADYQPWWDHAATGQLRDPTQPVPVNLDGLILSSLKHSSRIRALGAARMSAYSSVSDTMAAFDWRAFIDSKWIDTSDPVGSLLMTGGPSRYQDHDLSYGAGLRRDMPGGGRFEISQEIGVHNSNSIYLTPPNQGEGKLAARLSQPLLRGAGHSYNKRYIVLAQVEAGTVEKEFVRQAQTHLLSVSKAYWQLYLMRALLLQKQRLYEQGRQIHAQLDSRKEVDALASQMSEHWIRVGRHESIVNQGIDESAGDRFAVRPMVLRSRCTGKRGKPSLPAIPRF